MKISLLCSDKNHPVYSHLLGWQSKQAAKHEVSIFHRKDDLPGGDLLFLISCHEIIGAKDRALYRKTLLLHASDLPSGRGWSPLVWQIATGCNDVVLSLLEAEDAVDSGAIWAQRTLHFEGHELADEIHAALFSAELHLMDFALVNFDAATPRPQSNHGASYYPKRTREDSRLDPNKTLAEQFDLMRVADFDRYPSFFDFRGHRYKLKLEKVLQRDNHNDQDV